MGIKRKLTYRVERELVFDEKKILTSLKEAIHASKSIVPLSLDNHLLCEFKKL